MSLIPQASGGRQPMGPADRPLPVPTLSDREKLFLTNDRAADPELVVGVVDTGVALVDGAAPHPYLQDHLYEASEIDEWTPEFPYGGHGSFVAARILMEAPTATIDLRGPLGRPSDDPAADDRAVADAIRGLADAHGERLAVLNLSFAGYWDESTGPKEIRLALSELADRHDVLVVASTANRWIDQPSWPAAFTDDLPTVLAVGPADETVVSQDQDYDLIQPPASFASRWPHIDVYGSAVRVLGPTPAGGWCRWSGTSFAAASVSGTLAQLGARSRNWADLIRARPLINGKPYLRSAEVEALGQVGGGDG